MGGYNPIRRNRNIGTAKSGHGQDNRMSIPKVAHGENDFWERVENSRLVSRSVSGNVIRFFVQPTLRGCVHACTIDDITRMLSALPVNDWVGIEAILLRQPRRKEQTLAPVWGRLAYSAQLVNKRGAAIHHGPVVIIEAINPTEPVKYGKSLSPEGTAELERLKADGHKVRPDRHHTLEMTVASCRATQLYRTLLHEVGHWADFLEKVERPAAKSECDGLDIYEKLLARFHNRSAREREQFAHAYADRVRKTLFAAGAIPFERQFDRKRIERDGLRLQDFELP